MCLVVNCKYHKDKKMSPLVAKENILVYKYLGKWEYKNKISYLTPFRQEPVYFKNGIAEQIVRRFGYETELYENFKVVSKGIHSTKTFKLEKNYHRYYAVIPKGTKFYIGRDNDFVSKHLIIFENKDRMKEFYNNEKVWETKAYICKYLEKL